MAFGGWSFRGWLGGQSGIRRRALTRWLNGIYRDAGGYTRYNICRRSHDGDLVDQGRLLPFLHFVALSVLQVLSG